MEELSLLDLLECPLCLERLDASAKLLPCQHTFCKPCLHKQEASKSQLLCPECRTPAPARSVEELPANLLLVQLLEGFQGSGGASGARYVLPLARDGTAAGEGQQQQSINTRGREMQRQTAALQPAVLYKKDVSGEPALNPGAGQPRTDDNWSFGDVHNSGGTVPAGMWQGVHQTPQPQFPPQAELPALGRALYNFNPKDMDLEDYKYCLGFFKGDILTVIRRLDEHWIEAKLGDKVGILPLQFIEPNSVAAKLLEGKSRKGSDSAEFSHRTGSGGNDKGGNASNRAAQFGAVQIPAKTPLINALPLPGKGKPPSISNALYQTAKGQSSHLRGLTYQGEVQPQHASATLAAQRPALPSRVTPQHVKRHSDGSHRHLSQGEKKMNNETPPTITMALVNPQLPSASADGKTSSTQQLSISVCAALYSYKPRRPEELELRKGEMVGVYGKFNEGWLRGLSLRTGKVGILPGNYVTPVLRTSARLLEAKAGSVSSGTLAGKRPAASKNPAVVLALDRVNTDGTVYSKGQVPSAPNGAQHTMPSGGTGKSSLYGVSQGWDTVRRVFYPHRGSTQRGSQYAHTPNSSLPSHPQSLKQVQVSGQSLALQRKKHGGANPGRLGWMADTAAPSPDDALKDREFAVFQEAAFHPNKQLPNGPHSILVRPEMHKHNTEKPAKSVRFLTEEDSPPPRLRTSSWSSGNQIAPLDIPGPPLLEVWAPSLTLGRDGPGIILKEGKAPVLRKGLDVAVSDLNPNPQKQKTSQSLLPAASAQFSPSRHRVATTYLAQTDSELSLLQGEHVLVHRPRPDGRVLVTQESGGQTGLFQSSVLQALERFS